MHDEMDDELLDEVSAVGDTSEESGARNSYSTKRQPRAEGADKKCSHAESDEWKLPDARGDGEVFGFAQV